MIETTKHLVKKMNDVL